LIFFSKFSHKNGKFLLEKHVVQWEKNMFFHVYIFLLRKVVDETPANSLKGNTQQSKGEKKKQRKRTQVWAKKAKPKVSH
jgi:hypothetical protein